MVRFKNRYITVEVNPITNSSGPLDLNPFALFDAVMDAVEELHGDFGVGAVMGGILTRYCNKHTRVAIIRVRHGPHRLVASALPSISQIQKHRVTLRTLHTGATIKHSHLFLQRYQRAALDKMWANLKTDEERQMMEKAVMDLSEVDNLHFGKGYMGKPDVSKEEKAHSIVNT